MPPAGFNGGAARPIDVVAATEGRLSPADLLALVDDVVAAEALWMHLVVHDAKARSTLRLIATDHYEVQVPGWTPGQRVELHDHGPSHAAFRVVEGTLTELERGPRELTRRGRMTGSRRALPSGTVHDVLNESARPATSVHAYSPPLSSMTFYDDSAMRPVRSERVEATAPALHAPSTWPVGTARQLARS